MNVIIANSQSDKINALDIEVIKRLDGVFEVEEIISSFQNIFYNKMILDVTALKNPQDINSFQKLSIALDMNKLILLLQPGTESTLPTFLSKLISVGIYNFTTTTEGLTYLYNNPNTYRDVAQYHNLVAPTQEVVQSNETSQSRPEKEIVVVTTPAPKTQKVIGLKSVTPDAGATTLAYMMKKCLEKSCDVACIELDKNDFTYFNDTDLKSVSSDNIREFINNNSSKNVIIVDLNESTVGPNLCSDIIYLLEPSTIKLNKLATLKPTLLKGLKDKKVVLNKSQLNEKDVKDFSYEANLDIFYNLPSLDERKINDEVKNLLQKLNLM